MNARAVPISLDADEPVNALLGSSQWASTVLTYSFAEEVRDFGDDYGRQSEPDRGFEALGSGERDAVRRALDRWEEVGAIRFVEVESGGDLRFGYTQAASVAHAYGPSNHAIGGDVWFGPKFKSSSGKLADGSYSFFVIVHEIGHSVGLKHPHDGHGGSAASLDRGDDWLGTSVMSYRSAPGASIRGGYDASIYPDAPMALDIAALAHLYGDAPSSAQADSTYRFQSNGSHFDTIFDPGGHDEIVILGRKGARLDLEPGAWSRIGKAFEGAGRTIEETVAITADSLIEAATGGGGGDRIFGNALDNRLDGGAGHDKLFGREGDDRLAGGKGDDRLDGGAGRDSVILEGDFLDFELSVGKTSIRAIGKGDARSAGKDKLEAVEELVFNDLTIDLGASLESAELRIADAVQGFVRQPALGSVLIEDPSPV